MADKKTKIIIETESGSSERRLQQIAEQVKKVGNETQKSGSKVKSATGLMTTGFNSVAEAIKAVALGSTAKMAVSLAKSAAQFQEVSQYAKTAAESMGLSFERLDEATRKGANGMATNAEIMQSNLKALRGGLKASEDDFGRLWQIADAYSDQLGVSITQAFDQITTAITTGNQKSLVSMGLLPESFNKATDAATLLEKRTETLNTVLTQLYPVAQQLSAQGDTSIDKFTQLTTAVENAKLEFGEQLVPAMTVTVEWLKDVVLWSTNAAESLGLFYKAENDKTISGIDKIIADRKAKIKELDDGLNSTYTRSVSSMFSFIPGVDKGWSQMEMEREGYYREVRELENKKAKIIEENAEREKRFAEEQEARIKRQAELEAQLAKQKEAAANATNEKTKEAANREIAKLQKAIDGYANLADTILPKLPKTEAEAYDLLVKITAQAGGMGIAFGKATDKVKDLNDELSNTLAALNDDLGNSLLGGGTNRILDATNVFNSKTFGEKTAGAMSVMTPTGIAGVNIFGQIDGVKTDPKETAKKSFGAIANQLTEVIVSGVNGSNFADVMRSAIGSIATQKAQSYGSNLLGSLFSGEKIAGGVLGGFVGSLAVSAIANNWEKWFGDHGKEETMAKNAETRERGANAYLSTYSAMLSPYMADEMLYNLLDSRSDAGNMIVKYKSKTAGGLRGFVGGKNYSDATPQATFDIINGMEDAVEAINEYNDKEQKRLEILEAQGYDYQVLSAQMEALSDTMGRIQGMGANQSYTWENGQKFTIDLSDNIQDLKTAYYEALRQYGQETANRTTAVATNFLAYSPFVDSVSFGSAGSKWIENLVEYTKTETTGLEAVREAEKKLAEFQKEEGGNASTWYWNNVMRYQNSILNAQGQVKTNEINYVVDEGYREYWDDRGSVTSADGQKAIFDAISKVTTDYLDKNATTGMLDLIKQSGKNQFDLNALNYTDPTGYATAYVDYLQRQMDAAEYVMQQQEEIYNDATKTFEEQSGALQMYQDAQNQYYNAKLEMLSAEQAKEEQIKKEQQQAAARSAERMEALLGFTGEMARTGNAIYILEGANQMGALEELLEASKDNPQAVAAIQAMMNASKNQAKFGKM